MIELSSAARKSAAAPPYPARALLETGIYCFLSSSYCKKRSSGISDCSLDNPRPRLKIRDGCDEHLRRAIAHESGSAARVIQMAPGCKCAARSGARFNSLRHACTISTRLPCPATRDAVAATKSRLKRKIPGAGKPVAENQRECISRDGNQKRPRQFTVGAVRGLLVVAGPTNNVIALEDYGLSGSQCAV